MQFKSIGMSPIICPYLDPNPCAQVTYVNVSMVEFCAKFYDFSRKIVIHFKE